MNNGNDTSRAEPSQSDSGNVTLDDFDRWAEVDQEESLEFYAKSIGIPDWVISGGFSHFVLASRYFATEGEWPDGREPNHPSFEGLPSWKIAWLKGQKKNPDDWRTRTNQRRHERTKRQKARLLATDPVAYAAKQAEYRDAHRAKTKRHNRRKLAREELTGQEPIPAEQRVLICDSVPTLRGNTLAGIRAGRKAVRS